MALPLATCIICLSGLENLQAEGTKFKKVAVKKKRKEMCKVSTLFFTFLNCTY